MKKTRTEMARKSIFLLGVMILVGVFLLENASAVAIFGNSLDTGLQGYYSFDDASGTNIQENVSSIYNLTTYGTVNFITGIKGTAINITANANANETGAYYVNNTDFTIAFWNIQNGSLPYYSTVITTLSGSNKGFRVFARDEYNPSDKWCYAPSKDAKIYTYTTAFNDSIWHHYAITRVDDDYTFYLDGVNQSIVHDTTADLPQPRMELGEAGEVGSITVGHRIIDELGFWSRAITSAEVVTLNNSYGGGGGGLSTINISLLSPVNATTINTDGTDFHVNLSITGTNNSHSWINNTYYIWFNNGTLANTTFVNGLSTNQTNISNNIDSFIVGKTYFWNTYGCYGNSTTSNCSWATNNLTFTYVPFSNTGESYSASTYETQVETFYLNITTIPGASKMGAFLVYNGTFYAATHTCVGSACQVWRKIDIPLMTTTSLSSENKSFYWQITIFGTFGTSTSYTTTHNQNVSNLLFSNAGCVGGYNNSVNFTIYNETDRNLLDATFKSKFNFWIGEGTVKDTYNFSGNGHNNYLFCINHNLSYITSSYITINATNSRIYQLVKEIYTNALKVQKLFIPDNLYSNIIIEVKNQGLVPQKDVSVNISRYYPETDTYEIVEHQTTDEYGQIIAKLIQNDVKYKFNFFDASNNLLKTSDLVTVICRSSICVIPFVIETTTDYLEQYDTLPLFDYSLEFDNTTNIVTYSWDDQRGESSTHRLEVTRYAFNESTTVCNTTSTTTVSSLTCNVGSNPASYSVQTFRKVNGQTEIRITYLQIIVGDYSTTFGIEGLFWVFILLFTCIGIGVYDPKVGAILYGVGFIFMGIIKIIYMPLPVFFANTILVILFVWAVKT